MTLEDPVEYDIDGINQVQINEKTGMTFASGSARHPAPGPRYHRCGRDPRRRDGVYRHARRHHRPFSAVHGPHQRRPCPPCHVWWTSAWPVSHRRGSAGRHLPAAGAQHLPPLQKGLHPHPRKRLSQLGLPADTEISSSSAARAAPSARRHRLPGTHRGIRDAGVTAGCARPRHQGADYDACGSPRPAGGLCTLRRQLPRLVLSDGVTTIEDARAIHSTVE